MTKPLTIYKSDTEKAKSQECGLWDEVNRIFELYQAIPFAKELEAAFDSIPTAEIIRALEEKHWTGRKGYSPKAMLNVAIGMRLLGQPIFYRFQQEDLAGNPLLRRLCGFDNGDIPTRTAYSRFFDRLLEAEDLILDCLVQMVNLLQSNCQTWPKLLLLMPPKS